MDSIPAGCSQILPAESAILFPTFGRRELSGRGWRILVRGVLFDTHRARLRRRVAVRLLRRAMKNESAALEGEMFRRRIAPFLAATPAGRRIVVRIGRQLVPLPRPTDRSGRFAGVLRVGDEEGGLAESRSRRNVELVLPPNDERRLGCAVHLLSETGLTLVSDIDDTIKETEVARREALLANTFLRGFRPVDGMAATYRAWSERGAALHYVSKSPWQLFEPLAELLDAAGFPAGAMHLADFRLRDQMLRKLAMGRSGGKARAIRTIFEWFPRRRFVLVGDSGERDPEVYAALARRYAGRVAAILVRSLAERPFAAHRLARCEGASPGVAWRVFRRADEAHPDAFAGERYFFDQ